MWLHLLDPDPEEPWRRVAARNDQRGESCRVRVSRPMFDVIESIGQRPTPEEMADPSGLLDPTAPDSAPT